MEGGSKEGLSKEIRETIEDTAGPTAESARKVGEAIGKLCLEKGISKVAFDRGGFVYHGRMKGRGATATLLNEERRLIVSETP